MDNQINLIEKALLVDNKKYDEQIKQIEYNRSRENYFNLEVSKLMPELLKALSKKHLEISRISVRKTGESGDWSEGDYVKVGLLLSPTSDKFKFISFKGYDSRGAGKNQKQLNSKAEKLENHFSEILGGLSVAVNPFSMEDSRTARRGTENSSNSILMDFWLKK